MYEVKVFDNAGNIKKVISVKSLKNREDKMLTTPSIFKRAGRKTKPKFPHLFTNSKTFRKG